MRHKAWLARRSPLRCSRWRSVRPDEAGMGAVPHRCAKAASERSRWGLSPAVTSSCPAVSIPTPGRRPEWARPRRPVLGVERRGGRARPGVVASGRPGPQGGLGRGCWTGQGPGPHRRAGANQGFGLAAEQGLAQLFRSAGGHAVELLGGHHPGFEAPRRATRRTRIISTWPSRFLGVVAATPARVARAAAWASIGSDLPRRRRVLRSGRSTSTTWSP
jgi:hypothetical protein